MRSSWKLALCATVVGFLGAKPCQAQEKVDRADQIINKLSEVSQDLLEWKKENNERLKKAEKEVAELKKEVAELKKCVQDMKTASEGVKQTEQAKIDPPAVVQENPEPPKKPQPPVVTESQKPGTLQIVNTWGNAQVVVNGTLYKVSVGTTNISVKPGKVRYRCLEIPGQTVNEVVVGSGEMWQYKIYPDERPPTVPLYTSHDDIPPAVPLYIPNSYEPTVYYGNCQPVRHRLLPRLFRK